MNKIRLEGLLVPLLVSFFMSGINAILKGLDEGNLLILSILLDWIINWIIAYPCLLIVVPFSRKIVLKLFYTHQI